MDLDNVRCLKNDFPEALPHATLLGLFGKHASLTISDPYLSNGEETRRVSEQIQSAITGVADYLAHCKGMSCRSEMPSAAPGVQS
jgi:protein-tyrosine-phosphatase